MTYTYAWDETTPAGSEAISLGDNRIRELKNQIRERLATEHSDISASAGTALLMHEWAITTVNSNYTATLNDHVLLATGGAAGITITLPDATTCAGKPFKIKKVDSGAGAITIDGNGTQTIDGAATISLSYQYNYVDIVSDGSNWIIVSTNCNFDWDSMWGDAIHSHLSDAEGGALSFYGLKFLSSSVNLINWTATQTWTDVNISTHTGSDTAKAALLAATLTLSQIAGGGGNQLVAGCFRKKGTTPTYMPKITAGFYSQAEVNNFDSSSTMIIVECNSNEIFQANLQFEAGSSTYTAISYTVNLIGYFI